MCSAPLNPLRCCDGELLDGCVANGGFLASLFTFDSHVARNLWSKPNLFIYQLYHVILSFKDKIREVEGIMLSHNWNV